jgi:hypothetical protein
MTTEQNILEHLYTKGGPPVGDELLADADRVFEATAAHEITESEYVALCRDLFYRMSHDESRSIEVRADWNALAQAFENRLGKF